MLETLLHTKLFVPRRRPNLIARPHLVKRLDESVRRGRRLTLVSAPAGFGKSTLLSEWIAGSGRPTAWLSLDEADNDPPRFLTYLIGALQMLAQNGAALAADFGERSLATLQTAPTMPVEAVLTTLLNEITAIAVEFTLVIDDYHLLDSQVIDNALIFLIERMPAQMHLLIASREDPQFPLPRLRARGQLAELRVDDLRFRAAEAAAFLNQAMGLDLSAADVAALEQRTEGWIAGLQLAALSMEGRADKTKFVRAFTGSHRYVLDYLLEEVLGRQPETVRRFMLQTSLLAKLSGPLCDAVRFDADAGGPGDSRQLLAALERGNLFVIPLDDERQWYRYHHLFADVLQARALAELPEQIPTLHRRASRWYEQNGWPAAAIHHALAAADYPDAARLIESAWPAMEREAQVLTWLGWVRALPDEVIRDRPVLSVGCAWAILGAGGGELEAAAARLADAERWLALIPAAGDRAAAAAAGMIIADETQFQALPAAIAVARAYIALARGDVPGSVAYAEQTLALLPEENNQWRRVAAALLGFTYWERGDLEAAYETFADFMRRTRQVDGPNSAISVASLLGDIRIIQGQLGAALRVYEQSLQSIREQPEPAPRGTTELYVGLGEVCSERGDLATAAQHLRQAETLGAAAAVTANEYRRYPAMARIKAALGDLDGALARLAAAERLYYRTPVPNVRPIAAQKARVWLKQGRLDLALAWAAERGLSAADDVPYVREFEYITFAAITIAHYRTQPAPGGLDAVLELLERLRAAAEAGGRLSSVIEILTLQALALAAQGATAAALAPLERALALAEPEGHIRVFLDGGRPMAALLQEPAIKAIAPRQFREVQAAFGNSTAPVQSIADPLSERELEVLRLLRSDLKGPEIARELMVSVNTIRSHTKNIYSKLGVNSRRSAVRRAEELNLL